MPSTTTLVFALAIASTIAPTLAVPVYGPYSSNLARRNEQVARDLAYLIARTDESGALNWQQVKDFGKKAWAGVKTAARVAQPIVSALASREEAELFARLE